MKSTNKKNPPGIFSMLPFWETCQSPLSKVIRWAPFLRKNGALRTQSTLEHVHAFSVLSSVVITKLVEKGVKLDHPLFILAILVHDHGEGLLGRDIPVPQKSAEKDKDEYVAFTELLLKCDCDLSLFKKLKQAFLLQFAEECPQCFPLEARILMEELRKKRYFEVMLFKVLERVDYLFYACESYRHKEDDVILAEVFRNVKTELDKICTIYPVISTIVWTEEIQNWFQSFSDAHQNVSYEAKDPQLSLTLAGI